MNVLFTCAGRRTYLLKYFKEQLAGQGLIIGADMQLSAPALSVADVKVEVPAVYDPHYIDIVLDICEKHHADILISLNDLELPILAANKSRFDAVGVKVVISSEKVIDTCFDKYKTAKWIESIGLLSPKTFVRMSDVKVALASGELAFPLFMKPRWGSGSIGLTSVDDMEELESYYRLLRKKIKKTILATASVGEDYILIQENLTGQEYGLDVMNDLEGNYAGVSVKKKLAMRAGETDKAITVDLPELRDIGRKIGENLCHIGNLDVDIMQRGNGEYCVLELNPRFGGGFPFSYEAGVNLPKAILEWAKGNTINPEILMPRYNEMFSKCDYLVKE